MEAARALVEKLISENADLIEKVMNCLCRHHNMVPNLKCDSIMPFVREISRKCEKAMKGFAVNLRRPTEY